MFAQVFERSSHEIIINTEFCQGPAKSCSTLCTGKNRVLSRLVNCGIVQIMSMTNSVDSAPDSAASALDVLQLRLRSTVGLLQTLCSSGSELCSFCMQKM